MLDQHNQLQKRLDELESRFAFQEDLLESLNTMIADQQNELDKLWRANQLLKEQLTKLEHSSGTEPVEAPPPHY